MFVILVNGKSLLPVPPASTIPFIRLIIHQRAAEPPLVEYGR